MSDLAKNLLTQYYGLNSETTGRKFLSIHRSIENVKSEEVKQVTEQTSVTTNEENISEDECQKDTDDDRKLNIESEIYRRSSRAFNDIEDVYDSDESSIIYEIDSSQNVKHNIHKNTESGTERAEFSKTIPIIATKDDGFKDTNESDSSLTFAEDTFPDNASIVSSITLKKSVKSLKISSPLPSVTKKEPVCNETFADFSNTGLKQFPKEILNEISQLRMLYLGDNDLIELPGEMFTCLKHLKWLDIRNNQISSLPNSIESHKCIETLLLQANCIKELPLELCTLPKLKTLQVAQNPLVTPPKDIVALGITSILEFLRIEWNKIHPEHQIEFKEYKIEPKLSTILCYQSPRNSKKKIVPIKLQGYNRNSSIKEKCKTYKPSNRYSSDESTTLINSCLFKKNLTILCDSCLQKEVGTKIDEKSENTYKQAKNTCLRTMNDHRSKIDSCIDTKTDKVDNKILRLMGPSPRSLYVRQNVKVLKTYYKCIQKDCRVNLVTNKPECFVPLKTEKSYSLEENCTKHVSIGNVEHCFDIITNDRKRFKLYPMRLNNPDWMLSCLKNYIGINE
ncbi:uncharacterized protein LOC143354081 isoform X1 [Halictus rubicundus]|uniref:uncharacterized protein LOC143354081 isoform X1 n=1 Tax=Halictus rubicundus TaxID=77578 RepID=UPI0040368C85